MKSLTQVFVLFSDAIPLSPMLRTSRGQNIVQQFILIVENFSESKHPVALSTLSNATTFMGNLLLDCGKFALDAEGEISYNGYRISSTTKLTASADWDTTALGILLTLIDSEQSKGRDITLSLRKILGQADLLDLHLAGQVCRLLRYLIEADRIRQAAHHRGEGPAPSSFLSHFIEDESASLISNLIRLADRCNSEITKARVGKRSLVQEEANTAASCLISVLKTLLLLLEDSAGLKRLLDGGESISDLDKALQSIRGHLAGSEPQGNQAFETPPKPSKRIVRLTTGKRKDKEVDTILVLIDKLSAAISKATSEADDHDSPPDPIPEPEPIRTVPSDIHTPVPPQISDGSKGPIDAQADSIQNPDPPLTPQPKSNGEKDIQNGHSHESTDPLVETLPLCPWQAPCPEPLELVGHQHTVFSVCFSPDGTWIASGAADNIVRLWSPSLAAAIELKEHEDKVRALCFSPDGSTLVSGSEDRSVRLWSLRPASLGKCMQTLQKHEKAVRSVCFSSCGRFVASGSADSTVLIWDLGSVKSVPDQESSAASVPKIPKINVRVLRGHKGAVLSVSFSPDGAILASGSEDSTILLWHLPSTSPPKKLAGHKKAVSAARFSPDGRSLASCSGDKSIRLWSLPEGTCLRTWTAHEDVVTSLSFSADGLWLVSGSKDGSIRLWSASSQELQWTKVGSAQAVWSVAVSPDEGSVVVSGSADKKIRLWRR